MISLPFDPTLHVRSPKSLIRITEQPAESAVKNPTFGRIPIKVSKWLSGDQAVMMPSGEYVMSQEHYERLRRQINNPIDNSITGDNLDKSQTVAVETGLDPDNEAMQSSGLWGVF